MKIIIHIVLICLVGISLSCNNDDSNNEMEFKSIANLEGHDIALCLCCGDWLIKIENDQNRYQFKNLPQDSNIDLQNVQFPISVKLNWRLDENSACPNYIIIEQIELN